MSQGLRAGESLSGICEGRGMGQAAHPLGAAFEHLSVMDLNNIQDKLYLHLLLYKW